MNQLEEILQLRVRQTRVAVHTRHCAADRLPSAPALSLRLKKALTKLKQVLVRKHNLGDDIENTSLVERCLYAVKDVD